MKNNGNIPEIKNYLVFRYNIYMFEYMYMYIVGKIKKEYPVEKHHFMNVILGKDEKKLLYKIFNTNRTDFSKYKHSDDEQMKVTSKVRNVFYDWAEFEKYITGERLLVDNTSKEEEYPNDRYLELSEDTKASIITSVENAWKKLHDTLNYKDLEHMGATQKFAGWMIIRVSEEFTDLKDKEEKVDIRVLREIKHLDNISFDMLDKCEIETLKETADTLKKLQLKVNTIYNYKMQKNSR